MLNISFRGVLSCRLRLYSRNDYTHRLDHMEAITFQLGIVNWQHPMVSSSRTKIDNRAKYHGYFVVGRPVSILQIIIDGKAYAVHERIWIHSMGYFWRKYSWYWCCDIYKSALGSIIFIWWLHSTRQRKEFEALENDLGGRYKQASSSLNIFGIESNRAWIFYG